MTCDWIRGVLSLFLYGELSFEEEESVHGHLETCEPCRAALERERALHGALDQTALEPPPECSPNAGRGWGGPAEEVRATERLRPPVGLVRTARFGGVPAAGRSAGPGGGGLFRRPPDASPGARWTGLPSRRRFAICSPSHPAA